ncbi:hypothetical protein JYT72_00705 [Crocinitomix catalasitica]|nr:hypothetical protein [Crocinitomix catalasitica]
MCAVISPCYKTFAQSGDSLLGFYVTNVAELENDETQWRFDLFANDSAVLMGSWQIPGFHTNENNEQYYGRIVKSKKYDYEFVPSFQFMAAGCDKPPNHWLDTDTVGIVFDSTMLKELSAWNARVMALTDEGAKQVLRDKYP